MHSGKPVVLAELLDRRILLSAHFESVGEKWPQPGGPGTPAQITFSFSNLLDGQIGDPDVIRATILEALSLWTAVAPIQFTHVEDSGPAPSADQYPAGSTPNIRFGHYSIDGVDGSRATAYLPLNLDDGLSGDIHFDDSENWSNDPDLGLDLLEYATEQIGRALGVLPSDEIDSIMNLAYGEYFDGPGTGFIFHEDVHGIRGLYGQGFGYVLDQGTIHLAGTEATEHLQVNIAGAELVVARDQFSATVPLGSVSKITVNGHGEADWILFNNLSGLEFSAAGGQGVDTVQFRDDLMPSAQAYVVTNNQVSRTGAATLKISNDVESVAVWTSSHNDTVNVLQTSGAQLSTDSAGGQDVINLGGAFGVSEIASDVHIANTSGDSTVNINDLGNGVGRNIVITTSNFFQYIDGIAPARIDFAAPGIAAINLTSGQGSDTIRVRQNREILNINSSGGADTVILGDDVTAGTGLENVGGWIYVQNFSSFTTLILDDTKASSAASITWDVIGLDTRVTGHSPSGQIRYSNIDVSTVTLQASPFHDNYTFNNVAARLMVLGNDGNDTLTFNGTDAAALVEMNAGNGNDVININTDNSGNARVTQVGTDSIGMLNLAAGGRLRLSGLGTSLFVNSALLNGILDIGDGAFVRRNFAPNFSYYTDRLRNGYNAGAWNGAQPAILSSTAPTSVVIGDSVGYGFGNQTITSLGGITINPTDLVVRYTLEGDTNLDRAVDFNDLLRTAQNYGSSSRLWSQGNFNYDSTFKVDFNDLLMLAQKYGGTMFASRPAPAHSDSTVSRNVLGSSRDDRLWDD